MSKPGVGRSRLAARGGRGPGLIGGGPRGRTGSRAVDLPSSAVRFGDGQDWSFAGKVDGGWCGGAGSGHGGAGQCDGVSTDRCDGVQRVIGVTRRGRRKGDRGPVRDLDGPPHLDGARGGRRQRDGRAGGVDATRGDLKVRVARPVDATTRHSQPESVRDRELRSGVRQAGISVLTIDDVGEVTVVVRSVDLVCSLLD